MDTTNQPETAEPAAEPTDDVGLLIVAHGSPGDPPAGDVMRGHARRVDQTGGFADIQCGFWAEQPGFVDALEAVGGERVVAVPFFMSEGYFASRVVPRELGLEDAKRGVARMIEGRPFVYARAVGTHEAVEGIVRSHALRELKGGELKGEEVSPSEAALVLIGHGTPRHDRSSASTLRLAGAFREAGEWAQVEAAFLDEEPGVETVFERTSAPNLVVVPFFAADGFHSREDIPGELGLESAHLEVGRLEERRGRRVWYAEAVGAAPEMAGVVAQRARSALRGARRQRPQT